MFLGAYIISRSIVFNVRVISKVSKGEIGLGFIDPGGVEGSLFNRRPIINVISRNVGVIIPHGK